MMMGMLLYISSKNGTYRYEMQASGLRGHVAHQRPAGVQNLGVLIRSFCDGESEKQWNRQNPDPHFSALAGAHVTMRCISSNFMPAICYRSFLFFAFLSSFICRYWSH